MLKFILKDYCLSILKDQDLSQLTFTKDSNDTITYQELLESALKLKQELENFPETFLALKIKAPKILFTYLLASLFADKKVLILSDQLPADALIDIQKDIPYEKLIQDHNFSPSSAEITYTLTDINLFLPRIFLLSSGSTGASKAYGISIENILSSVESLKNEIAFTPSDCTLISLPHYHIGGLMIYWRAFLTMSSLTSVPKDYTVTSLVPLQLKRLIENHEKISELKKCKAIFIGGGLFDEVTKQKAMGLNLNIFETYGMTETTSMVLLNGKPLTNQEIKIDSDGHFAIKGPTLSKGYYQHKSFHPLALDKEGFYHTKDAGLKSIDQTFKFLHRTDLFFKSAGEMINPLVIESKVKELSFIKDAVVVPIAHPEWTNAAALIIFTDEFNASFSEEIKTYLKKSLHPYQIPKFIFRKEQSVEQTSVKPKRSELRTFAQIKHSQSLFHFHFIKKDSDTLVVVFHGFMEDSHDMMELFNDSPHSLLFIDLPGHGQSPIHHFESRESLFLALKNLIEGFRQSDLFYYGYSMGGRIALELALFHLTPQKIIIESGSFGLSTAKEKDQRRESDLALFSSPFQYNEFFTQWYSHPLFYTYKNSENYEKDLLKKSAHDYLLWKRSLVFFSPGATPYLLVDILNKIKAINMKIAVIFGEKDSKYKEHFEMIKEKISTIEFFEIKNSGHNPHKTHPHEISLLVKKLL